MSARRVGQAARARREVPANGGARRPLGVAALVLAGLAAGAPGALAMSPGGATAAARPAAAATATAPAAATPTSARPAPAEIQLSTAWMRPAAAGSDARAYVDIRSDAPLTLARATSPLARRVDIVVVRRTDGEDPGRVVASLPVAQGVTRLAYKGNHLRLVGVREELGNGRRVPLVLEFRDGAGHRYTAEAEVQVRGLLVPHLAGAPGADAPASGRPDGARPVRAPR